MPVRLKALKLPVCRIVNLRRRTRVRPTLNEFGCVLEFDSRDLVIWFTPRIPSCTRHFIWSSSKCVHLNFHLISTNWPSFFVLASIPTSFNTFHLNSWARLSNMVLNVEQDAGDPLDKPSEHLWSHRVSVALCQCFKDITTNLSFLVRVLRSELRSKSLGIQKAVWWVT